MKKASILWQNRFYRLLRFFVLLNCFFKFTNAIAKFEISSVSTTSIIVRMISAANVSRFEMDVTIYDLDRLREFRRTELSAGRHDDELSFDSLIPATWFAIRIEYRLIYHTSDGGYSDFPTKQELIVQTKNDSLISPTLINDQIIFIEGVVTDERDVNVTVSSAFQATSRLSTLIVPELQCLRGIVKPPAQRVISLAKIHFDLRKNMRNTNRFDNPHCSKLCIFPFIRAEITDIGQQTFRGKEWCGTVEEALDLISNKSLKTVIVSKVLIIFAFLIVFINVFRC